MCGLQRPSHQNAQVVHLEQARNQSRRVVKINDTPIILNKNLIEEMNWEKTKKGDPNRAAVDDEDFKVLESNKM